MLYRHDRNTHTHTQHVACYYAVTSRRLRGGRAVDAGLAVVAVGVTCRCLHSRRASELMAAALPDTPCTSTITDVGVEAHTVTVATPVSVTPSRLTTLGAHAQVAGPLDVCGPVNAAWTVSTTSVAVKALPSPPLRVSTTAWSGDSG